MTHPQEPSSGPKDGELDVTHDDLGNPISMTGDSQDLTSQHTGEALDTTHQQLDLLEKTEVRTPSDSPEVTPSASFGSQRDLDALEGSSLDHYLIESLVGQGGMGAVYRGRDQRLDRIVAIKVVPITNRKADAMRRFRIEAQSAAKLDHPNIARVYYVGETERWSYIVFEFIEGINLRQLVLERGPLSVDDATHFTCQVAEALQHASERGVVHRDIKPSNILLGTDGLAKIVDMGLARTTALDRSTGDQTASGTTLGTFDYISPEQAQDPRDADVRSDIYSLGCTLYFLLTGQPPFPDGTALQKLLMHGNKMPEDPRIFRDDLSDALIAILRKMMAKKPKDRYQSPEDLANDLRLLAKHDQLAWGSDLAETTFLGPQANRSWVEAMLPLILSLLLISAVTLWLFNSNQVDAVFPIPRVEVANVSLTTTNPTNDQAEATPTKTPSNTNTSEEGPADSSPITQLQSTNTATGPSFQNVAQASHAEWSHLLVSENTLTQTQRQALGSIEFLEEFRTLEDALTKASNLSSDCKIWIAGNCSMKKPWRNATAAKSGTIAIESLPNQRAYLTIDETNLPTPSGSEHAAWFHIDSAQLHFNQIDLYYKPANNNSVPIQKAIVALKGSSRCLMDQCTVTIENSTAQESTQVVQVHREDSEKDASQPARLSELRVQQSAIRGGCNFIATDGLDRMDVHVRESWIAIAGSMVLSESLRTQNRSPRIRMELDDATCITLSPWLKVRLSNTTPYPIAVVRISNQSVYAGAKALVEWDATDCSDWAFASQAKKLEELGRWIDFRGLDNAYDATTLEQWIHVQMSMSSEALDIQTDSSLLRNELGMEVLGLWQQRSTWDPLQLHELQPQAISQGTVGFRVGVPTERIPDFPKRAAKSAASGSIYPASKLAP